MLDVFFLLPVSRGFFQSLDDQRGCGWNNRDSCLSVLNSESDRDALGDVNWSAPGSSYCNAYGSTP